MKCTEHDREHCSHCAVLARCAALIPTDPLARIQWAVGHEYHDITTETFQAKIAARLVAWIRWRGVSDWQTHIERAAVAHGMSAGVAGEGVLRTMRDMAARDGHPSEETFSHPLDPLGLTWAQRVAMSRECYCVRADRPCGHDGWAFVSVICDQLDQSAVVDWSMVHAFRELRDTAGNVDDAFSRLMLHDRRPEMLENMRFTLDALREGADSIHAVTHPDYEPMEN